MAPLPSRMTPQKEVFDERAPAGDKHDAASNGTPLPGARPPPKQQQHARAAQQQQQQQQLRQSNTNSPTVAESAASSRRSGSRATGFGTALSEDSSLKTTPLFQRLVSDEVQELKSYAHIIESQNRRLKELERVHADLEARLEVERTGRVDMERSLQERELEWANRIAELEQDRDKWKDTVQIEVSKNDRLRQDVDRKEKEIHRMLQRKYDNQMDTAFRGKRPLAPSERSITTIGSNAIKPSQMSNGDLSRLQHKSPYEILAASGSVEAIRERNVSNALFDFFGIGQR